MAEPKVTKNKVSQTINLKTEFGIDFSGKRALREAIGEAILERIRSRSQAGKGMKFGKGGVGRKVDLKSPYSKMYRNSDEFKAFGKKKDEVNMTLTGDMLGLMDIVKQSGNEITIGWEDVEENNKAFNHVTGDTVPERPFFGVSKSELKDIKREFKSDIREALKVQKDEGRRAFEEFALGLINRIRGEDGS